MIPQRNISLLSNRLARQGGRRIPEAVLERDYCLAWFLAGLSRYGLRDMLAFKGGTAIKRCYFGDYRFSEDLDFTLVEQISLEEILVALEDVYSEVRNATGIMFHYKRADRKQHLNSYTFYLGYEGPLPGGSPKQVKVDITINERFVCALQDRRIVRGYDEYEDLPEDRTVQVYSLEEIAVEKVVAITDRARNEPRDLYDLWYLTSNGHVDLTMLAPEIDAKLEFRSRTCENLVEELAGKQKRYEKLWKVRLGAQLAELPHYDQVYRDVYRAMRSAGLQDR